MDNRVHQGSRMPGYQVFANEGRNFTVARLPPDTASPANTTLGALDMVPRRNETRSLRNRIAQSEDLQAWTLKNSIAVSQPPVTETTDPFGLNRAFRLSLSGKLPPAQHISQKIDMSALTVGSRVVIKFWAKRGTLSMLRVGVFHENVNPPQWHGNLFSASLGSDWRQYKFVTNGLVSATNTDVFGLYFYPGDSEQTIGDIFLFAPQVSDDDSDYYPTGKNPAYDPSAGNRFEQAPVITSLKTMTNSGDPLPKPSSTWVPDVFPPGSNTPPGTASLEAGSSDFAGVIQLKVTSGKPTSGFVDVTYKKPYVGTNSPVVVACLVDETGAWGSASVRVSSAKPSNTGFTLNWTDSAGLVSGKTYGLSYIVIGRT
jgi:hypothetical protein